MNEWMNITGGLRGTHIYGIIVGFVMQNTLEPVHNFVLTDINGADNKTSSMFSYV